MMEKKKIQNTLCLWVLVAAVVVFPAVMCRTTFEDQKNYYPPDPHSGGSHGGGSHHSPSHGSGGKHGSGKTCPPTTTTPSPPTHSGGGYHYSPPTTPVISDPPPTPVSYSPPTVSDPPPTSYSPPSTGGDLPPVIIGTPPSTPTDPDISSPPTPLIPNDPSLPPFDGTCNFWRTHPDMILGVFGWWASVGGIFGGGLGAISSDPHSLPTDLSLHDALANTRTDGIGALYREGTASLLNSMVTRKFPFSTQQIKELFVKALHSENTAAAQAQLFQKANEGRLKPKA